MRRLVYAVVPLFAVSLALAVAVPLRNRFQGPIQSDEGLMCSTVAAGGNAWTFQPCTDGFDTARPYASGWLFRWRGDPDSDSTFEQLATCDWKNAWQFGGYDEDGDGTTQYATIDIKGVFTGSAGGTFNSRAVTVDAHQVITSGGVSYNDHIAIRGRTVGHGGNDTGHTIGVQGTVSTGSSAQSSNIKFIGVQGDSALSYRNNGQIGVLGTASAGDINLGADFAGVYGNVRYSSTSGSSGSPAGVVGEFLAVGSSSIQISEYDNWISYAGVRSRGDMFISPFYTASENSLPWEAFSGRLVMQNNTLCDSATAKSHGQSCTTGAECASGNCYSSVCMGGGDATDCTGSGKACFSTGPGAAAFYIYPPNRFTDETGAASCANDTNKFHHYVWPWKLDSAYSGYILGIDPAITANPAEATISAGPGVIYRPGDHAFATLNWLSPASIVSSGGGVPSTRTLTGGTGIDIPLGVESADLSANRTLDFDATEINSTTYGNNTTNPITVTYDVTGSGQDPKMKMGHHSGSVAAFDYTVPDGCLTAGDLVWRISHSDGSNGLFKMNCKGDIELAGDADVTFGAPAAGGDILCGVDEGCDLGSGTVQFRVLNATRINAGGDFWVQSDTILKDVAATSALKLKFYDPDGSHFFQVQSGSSNRTGDQGWIWPTVSGTSGYILKTDGFPGEEQLSWTDTAPKATVLASNPSDCSANQFANAIAASGDLTCGAIADADVPDSITITGANGIKSATTTVNTSSATAPAANQVLTATSDTAATWQADKGNPILSGRHLRWATPKGGTATDFAVVGFPNHTWSATPTAAADSMAGRFAIKYETNYGATTEYNAGARFAVAWQARPSYRPKLATRIKTGSAVTSTKIWVAATEAENPHLLTFALTSAASTTDYVAVVYDSAVNSGKWMCCSGDGTNHDCDDMGGSAVAADTEYLITADWGTAGTLVCTANSTTASRSANLSTATVALFAVAEISTQDVAAEKHFYISGLSLEMN